MVLIVGYENSYARVDEDDNNSEFHLLSNHELDAFNTPIP